MEITNDTVELLKSFKDEFANVLLRFVVKGDIEKQLKEVLKTGLMVQEFVREREKTIHLDELTEDEKNFLEKIDADRRNAEMATTQPAE